MSVNSALLAQIQQGKKLRKAETNDRSGPLVEAAKPSGVGGTRAAVASAPVPGGGGPPQLGSLFAGGIPKLKPAGQQPIGTLGKPPSVPRRGGSGPSTPVLPETPPRSTPPLPPSRELPGRAVPAPPQPPAAPSAPVPPRRPPPPARPASPPPRRPPPPARPASPPPRRPPPPARPASPSLRPPALPPRSVSPLPRPASSGPGSTPSRQAPSSLSSSQSLSLPARKFPPPPTTSGRPPPPPPPRPLATKTATTTTTPSLPPRAAPLPPPRRNPQPSEDEETPPPQPAGVVPPPPPSRRTPQPKAEEEASSSQPTRAIPPPPSRKIPQQTPIAEPASRARAASTGGSGVTPTLPLKSFNSGLVPAVSRLPEEPPLGMRGASPGRRAISVSVSNMNGAGRTGPKPVTSSRIPSPPPSLGPHTFPTSSDFPPPRTFTRSAKKYASGNVRGSGFDVSSVLR